MVGCVDACRAASAVHGVRWTKAVQRRPNDAKRTRGGIVGLMNLCRSGESDGGTGGLDVWQRRQECCGGRQESKGAVKQAAT